MLKNAGFSYLLHSYIVKSSLFRKSSLSEMLHCFAISYQPSAVGYLPDAKQIIHNPETSGCSTIFIFDLDY